MVGSTGVRRAAILSAVLMTGGLAGGVAEAQVPRGQLKATTLFVGNSFGGAGDRWVQNCLDEIEVSSDGIVYTQGPWDENGRVAGIYFGGDVDPDIMKQPPPGDNNAWGWGTAGHAVAISNQFIYLVNNADNAELLQFRRDNQAYVKKVSGVGDTVGMTQFNNELYLIGESGTVTVRDASNLSVKRTFSAPGASDLAVANDGTLWILRGQQVNRYTSTGTQLAQTISGLDAPSAVSIDRNTGQLIVTENGPAQQVYFYDVTKASLPRVSTFGQFGGIAAGTPGEVEPDKFFHLRGAATDSAGNLYVAMSKGSPDEGTTIRAFTPTRTQSWEVFGHQFTDGAVFDPTSDGTVVFGGEERYLVDYSKPLGQHQTFASYTHDPINQPNDPRNGSMSPAFARQIDGRTLVYMTGMFSQPLYVYSWDESQDQLLHHIHTYERQLPLNFGIYADANGDIWESGDRNIRHTPFVGFNSQGAPVFGATQHIAVPGDFRHVERLLYEPSSDTMILTGFTNTLPYDFGWGIVGRVMVRYDNWSAGNRTESWRTILPWDPHGSTPLWVQGIAEAGDFIFTVGCQTRAEVWIWRKSDGTMVGSFLPDFDVTGPLDATGWIDIPYGISATQRENGEYVILIEEDGRAKTLLYRWAPETIDGDSDNDGDVDFDDLGVLLGNYDMAVTPNWGGDFDGDGDVDFTDLGLLLGNYGFGEGVLAPGAPDAAVYAAIAAAGIDMASVPEPGAAGAAAVAAGAALLRRRRSR